ncbi:hypothetical protein, partial [Sphingomonas sp. 10B4]|uniref:hypothetical protein n=1 Tax=Sphingomonas sp. 10B4 TaxID=3048575 RepID=UPI002B230D10
LGITPIYPTRFPTGIPNVSFATKPLDINTRIRSPHATTESELKHLNSQVSALRVEMVRMKELLQTIADNTASRPQNSDLGLLGPTGVAAYTTNAVDLATRP